MKRAFGGIALLMGSALVIWVGYNLLIERQPETQGKNPLAALGVGVAMIVVGAKWVRGDQAG